MARRKSPTFTEVELEFMHIVWDKEEVSTEDMQNALKEQGRDLSDGSIRKILSILMTKGHLERRRAGRSFYYKSTVSRNQAQKNMIQDLKKRAFNGSFELMAAALIDSRDVNADDLETVKKLIEEYEEK